MSQGMAGQLHNIPAVSNVILHAFDWTYQSIAEQAEQIAALGYRSVLVSWYS
jgi:alpha-amylase